MSLFYRKSGILAYVLVNHFESIVKMGDDHKKHHKNSLVTTILIDGIY